MFDKDEPLPEPRPKRPAQTMVQMGDIMAVLPPSVQKQCMDVMNSEPDSGEAYTWLKLLVEPYAAELLTVGVVAGYFPLMLLQAREQLKKGVTARSLFGPHSLN